MDKNLYTLTPQTIVVYSTNWCPDCKRARALLDETHTKYLEVDIGKDNEAFLFVEKTTRRVRIPTIFFPDGTFLIEPSNNDLEAKIMQFQKS